MSPSLRHGMALQVVTITDFGRHVFYCDVIFYLKYVTILAYYNCLLLR